MIQAVSQHSSFQCWISAYFIKRTGDFLILGSTTSFSEVFATCLRTVEDFSGYSFMSMTRLSVLDKHHDILGPLFSFQNQFYFILFLSGPHKRDNTPYNKRVLSFIALGVTSYCCSLSVSSPFGVGVSFHCLAQWNLLSFNHSFAACQWKIGGTCHRIGNNSQGQSALSMFLFAERSHQGALKINMPLIMIYCLI